MIGDDCPAPPYRCMNKRERERERKESKLFDNMIQPGCNLRYNTLSSLVSKIQLRYLNKEREDCQHEAGFLLGAQGMGRGCKDVCPPL